MGLAQLLVPFLTTWFCIHVFLFLLQRFLNRPNLPVGPGSGPVRVWEQAALFMCPMCSPDRALALAGDAPT